MLGATQQTRLSHLGPRVWQGNDNEYAHIREADIPLAECLKDTVERTLP